MVVCVFFATPAPAFIFMFNIASELHQNELNVVGLEMVTVGPGSESGIVSLRLVVISLHNKKNTHT